MNKKQFLGEISYKVNNNHRDIKYIEDVEELKIYSDIYRFDDHYTLEDIESYIRRDLALVAGGGYDTKGLEYYSFRIKQVTSKEIIEFEEARSKRIKELKKSN